MLEAARFEHVEADDVQGWRMFHREDTFDYLWHFHPQYELTLIVSGHGTRYIGDSIGDFSPGDLVLIGPNLPHTYVSTSPAAALCSQFDDDLIGNGSTPRPEFAAVVDLLDRSRHGLRFHTTDPAAWWSTFHATPARRTLGLLGHLVDLADRTDGQALSTVRYEPTLDLGAMSRLDSLLRHIDEHLAEPIGLEDLAGVAHLSPTATSRFFRRQTGHTITDYLNRARVAAACRLLVAADDPIGQVAWRCGFGNLSNFHRQFRRITGLTPRAYRQQRLRCSAR